MKKGGISPVIAIIVIIALIVLFTVFSMLTFKKISLNPPSTCQKDSDCVKVKTSCCSCSSGGEEICATKSEAKNYQDKLKNCSSDNFCVQVYNCNIMNCVCGEGKCQG